MRRSRLAVALPLALVVTLGIAVAPVGAGGRPFSTTLTGAAEAPDPGDPDGSGTARVWVNAGQAEVCYLYTVTGVAPLLAAHIHFAPAGVAGGVVVPLPPTSATGGSGCVDADRDLLIKILTDPSGYYVNVHNADFPAGALRGQLSREP